ncbi:class I SAM-dependent methyltransferase [Betaproteobacteria bacterium]|nr:class I SAM-dependent methyltransferase [Betaproteobacteria bacterium]
MYCRSCDSKNLIVLGSFEGFPPSAQAFCDSKELALKLKSGKIQLLQCLACDLIQIDSIPVDYYKSVITAASLGEKSRENLQKEWKKIVKDFHINPNAELLEVGAGKGSFVSLLGNMGFNAVGIEYSDSIEAGKYISSNVLSGYFPGFTMSKKFDLLVCNNFLEHHPNPRLFLNCFHEHLVDNGIIYISVPRFEYLLAKGAFYELIPDHLSYFTENSLRILLMSNGFEVLQYYTKNNDNDHVIIARKKEKFAISDKLQIFTDTLEALEVFLKEKNAVGKSVSVWGAGHRSLTLLAMTQRREMLVRDIVDSALFKQNKFAPNTGLRIISPKDFFKKPTDVLLLMLPGAYTEQVISTINEEIRYTLEVYCFTDSPVIDRRF